MSAAGTIGRTYLHESDEAACFAGYLVRFRPGKTVDPRFVSYWTQSTPFLDQLNVGAVRSTIDNFSAGKYQNLSLSVPDLAAQRLVADYLDAATARIDLLITQRQRMMSLLDARFLEKVRDAVTGGMSLLDPLGVRSCDMSIPGWKPVKLATDLRFGSGTTPTAGDERYYGPGTPWLVTGNLRDAPVTEAAGSVTDEALRMFASLKIHPAGALVVAMYGATIGRLGITTFPTAVNQACCVIHTGRLTDVGFLFYYLLAHRDVLVERAVGAGQPNISQEILRSLRIPVPSRSRQAEIVDELRRVGSRTQQASTRLGDQVDLLLERRQALITAAVTGQLEIPGVAA